jgi:hypothetical protein
VSDANRFHALDAARAFALLTGSTAGSTSQVSAF